MMHTEQGLAIRAERLARNMTQAHLAAMAGMSEKTVRRAEMGERIAADSIRAICAALDLDAANLRSEAEMSPQASLEMDVRAGAAAFHARAGAGMLAVSCFLTMAALVFEIPAGLVTLILVLAMSAATFSLLTASVVMLARPDWRERFVTLAGTRYVLARIETFEGPGRFILCMAATPPAIGFAVLALREMLHEPRPGAAFVLLLNLSLAAALSALTVSIMGGSLVTTRPSRDSAESRT